MSNGFEININEMDFRAKPQGEQNWILFQGIMAANNGIAEIEKSGCDFARRKHKENLKWTLSAMVGAVVFALGIVYIIYQMTCK